MRVTVDTFNIERVERNIAPPMGQAVTLPVKLDGQLRGGISVYVSQSVFATSIRGGTLVAIARQVAEALEHHDAEADLADQGP